ncbi:MAG: hypothetical protein IJ168_08035 [Eubacterium sp.]|nr:hypothetical protein [Eubacterium sp.]
MIKRVFTPEETAAIVNDYKNNVVVRDIYSKYRLTSNQLTKILQENGVEQRMPRGNSTNSTKRFRTCQCCKRKVEVRGARFCPSCGSDIRSEEQLLNERLNKLFTMLMALPSSQRDEAQQIIKDVAVYLNKQVN